jgi:hypothetical protein
MREDRCLQAALEAGSQSYRGQSIWVLQQQAFGTLRDCADLPRRTLNKKQRLDSPQDSQQVESTKELEPIARETVKIEKEAVLPLVIKGFNLASKFMSLFQRKLKQY